MSQYEHEFSNFPEKKIVLHHFQNIDDDIAPVIERINSLRLLGQYAQAAEIIKENKELLSPYIVDAVTFRTWEEEIYNTQIYTKQRQQIVFFDEEEPECLTGDIWVGGGT